MPNTFVILVDNESQIENLANQIRNGEPSEHFGFLKSKKGAIFSNSEIERFIWEEEQHDLRGLAKKRPQPLRSLSSGERKKALLEHVLLGKPDFLVLVNPFDNLDVKSQEDLRKKLDMVEKSIFLIQLLSRTDDILQNSDVFFSYMSNTLTTYGDIKELKRSMINKSVRVINTIPPPLNKPNTVIEENLVVFKNVEVSYNGKCILNRINWTIKKNQFWQLLGPNGSGKTTLLTLITGDNHKGYRQDLTLFGRKKGSGESVWDIKEHIGYFTPSMVDQFRGYHSAIHMLVSGLHDSVGLYQEPTDAELNVADAWLRVVQLETKRNNQFRELSNGQKRLLMLARAMIKHPPLLILDEPTAGLDDTTALFFVELVNRISTESDTTIVFVSHRKEAGLNPNFIFELHPQNSGSKGKIHAI